MIIKCQVDKLITAIRAGKLCPLCSSKVSQLIEEIYKIVSDDKFLHLQSHQCDWGGLRGLQRPLRHQQHDLDLGQQEDRL